MAMLSFGLPLLLAGTAVAQTSTISVLYPYLYEDVNQEGVMGSVINVDSNAHTTLAFSCDYDSYYYGDCDIYDDYTVTVASDFFNYESTYSDDDWEDSYTVSAGCQVAASSAVCTMSESGGESWEDYCDPYGTNEPSQVASCLLEYSTHPAAATITTLADYEMAYLTITVTDGADLLSPATAGAAASVTDSAYATSSAAAETGGASSTTRSNFASEHGITVTATSSGSTATSTGANSSVAAQTANVAVDVRAGASLAGVAGFMMAVLAL